MIRLFYYVYSRENKYQKKGTTFKFYYCVSLCSLLFSFQLFIKKISVCTTFLFHPLLRRSRQKKITFINSNIWGCWLQCEYDVFTMKSGGYETRRNKLLFRLQNRNVFNFLKSREQERYCKMDLEDDEHEMTLLRCCKDDAMSWVRTMRFGSTLFESRAMF